MNEENKQLLDEVIADRLEQALQLKAEDEGFNIVFKQAMDAIDRRLELSKIEASDEQALKKQELAEQDMQKKYELAEEELKKKQEQLEQEARRQEFAELELKQKQERAEKDMKIGWILKGVELGLLVVVVPIIRYRTNKGYAKLLCNFEKDYTFTTSGGRSLSRLFKFDN